MLKINDEEALINLALKLDQSKDADLRARARALRGMAVPMFNHLNSEVDRWSSEENFVASISSMSDIFASLIYSLANHVGDKKERLNFAADFLQSITMKIAIMEEGARRSEHNNTNKEMN